MGISVLRAFLGQIHTALIKYKRNRTLIKECTNFLHHGRYSNSVSFDCIYNTHSRSQFYSTTFTAQIDNLYQLSKVLIRLFNYCFTYKVHNKDNCMAFDGTEILVSSSLTELKIFDFKNDLVLTTYKSKAKLLKVHDAKQLFAHTFNIPSTLELNIDRAYLIEELIQHSNFDLEVLFSLLCDHFYRHLTYYSSQIVLNGNWYQEACSYFEARIGKCDLINEAVGAIMVYSHGDLWSSNIIFNGERVYVTDFEHAGVRFFLYDFFMFVFTEWQLKDDDRLVANYFQGVYDSFLTCMFRTVGLVFDSSRRNNYFMVFIVSILFERWRGYDAIDGKIVSFMNYYIRPCAEML